MSQSKGDHTNDLPISLIVIFHMQFVIIATFHTFFKTMLFARSLQCGIEIGVGLLKDSMNTMVSLTGAVSVT